MPLRNPPRLRSAANTAVVLLSLLVVLPVAACGPGTPTAEADGGEDQLRKITVAGDSIALGLGVTLREELDGSDDAEGTEAKVIAEDGTGLARPDVFDWPERLERLAAEFPPDVLVFSVGSNDSQDLTDPEGEVVATMADTEAWEAEYGARLARVFDAFGDTGTTVVWVGHVRTEVASVADGNRRIHELASRVAAERPWVRVEDLAELTGSGAESTSECLSGDGLHLEPGCYAEASAVLLDRY